MAMSRPRPEERAATSFAHRSATCALKHASRGISPRSIPRYTVRRQGEASKHMAQRSLLSGLEYRHLETRERLPFKCVDCKRKLEE